jgi:hypothetical protein
MKILVLAPVLILFLTGVSSFQKKSPESDNSLFKPAKEISFDEAQKHVLSIYDKSEIIIPISN